MRRMRVHVPQVGGRAFLVGVVCLSQVLTGCSVFENVRKGLEAETVRTDNFRDAVGNALVDRSIDASDSQYEELMMSIDSAEILMEQACKHVHLATRRPFIDKNTDVISVWGKIRAYRERRQCECIARDVLASPVLVDASSYAEIVTAYPDMCPSITSRERAP